jgi:N-acetylmuramic acid 6-phosphate (MurNAc-6-P) etherase
LSIEKVLHQIEPLITAVVEKMKSGGRMFYIGAERADASVLLTRRKFHLHTESHMEE